MIGGPEKLDKPESGFGKMNSLKSATSKHSELEDDYEDDFEASASLVEDLTNFGKGSSFKAPLPLISDIGVSKT